MHAQQTKEKNIKHQMSNFHNSIVIKIEGVC